ncbi:MAG: tetratricopeptide repeat protein [Roseiflexaceae bacterium]|nr:tetratricopeptide repeat protein [Roseiflexaceae bacterium]
MSTAINSFIPMDRRHALVRGAPLADRTSGAALFADISGFTPLTEALAAALNPQRGAEELSALLDQVYAALTAEIDRYGGSVIGFSGDAITCWFDRDHGIRAITCATELQSVMRVFATLSLAGGVQAALGIKVAVSIGPARRFLVGDPAIRHIEVLAGATIDRLATAERQAKRGEIVLVAEDAEQLASAIETTELRVAEESGVRVAVVGRILAPANPAPWPELPDTIITPDTARPWLLPAVFERLQGAHGLFVNELRPAVALFVGFGDLDYDGDDRAGEQLNDYVRWVQRVLARYEGVLLDITMGDKGGYLYAVFGLPQAHPDDAARAAEAAIELRNPPARLAAITRTQIGIAGGQVRSGTYGGSTRTYGALGEQVNLAARLMQAAAPSQILLSARLAPIVARRCILQPLPPIGVKGRRTPVAVSAVAGVRASNSAQLTEPHYTLPIVGREQQIAEIITFLDRSLSGHGTIVSVVGEAGLGKSRLVAEVIHRAIETGIACYIGEAPSYGMSVTYLAWRPIWRDFFGLSGDLSSAEQVQQLAHALETLGPGIVARMPLLSPVLDLPIADNDLTLNLDARVRKEALETLLIDCLQARAQRNPLLIVLEDAHWLDPLSIDLLAAIARILPSIPVLLLLAYRPPEAEPGLSPLITATPAAQQIRLGELNDIEAARLVSFKLAALFGAQAILAPELAARIAERAQGNPFYIEELLNYLNDCGIAPDDTHAIERLDLPESLAQLLLGRVDRLSSDQQTTLKVASIIGRLFPANWLRGVYPDLGSEDRIRHNLESLAQLELTPLHSDEPELNYLFKHVITQEVVYESLPFRLREQLHEQLADWLEQTLAINLPLDILAFHYGRSSNRSKQREYYRRAGIAAGTNYANAAAIHYYTELLLLLDQSERPEIEVQLGQILERIGERNAAEQHYRAAVSGLGTQTTALHALAFATLGGLLWESNRFDEATQYLEQARSEYRTLNDAAGLIETLCEMAAMNRIQGSFAKGYALLDEARIYAEQTNDINGLARVLHTYGTLTFTAGDYLAAQQWFLQALELRRQQGHRFGMAALENNLGMVLLKLGDSEQSLRYVQAALVIFDTLGDRRTASISRMTLGRVYSQIRQPQQARALFKQSVAVFDTVGVQWEIATATVGLAGATWWEGQPLDQLERAIRLCAIADGILASVGAILQYNDRETLEAIIAAGHTHYGEPATTAIWVAARALPRRDALAYIQE